MKKILWSSLFLLLNLQLFAQTPPNEFGVKMIFEDSTGQQDSIRYGAYAYTNGYTATLGTDTIFGEVANIWGQPYSNLDARVVQRDSSNYSCYSFSHFLSNGQTALPFYFDSNRAAKVDIRPFIYGTNPVNNKQNFESTSFAYEIEIKATDYPIQVTADFSKAGFLHLHEFYLMDDSCQLDTNYFHYSNSDAISFTITDSTTTTILVLMSHEVATQEIEDISTSFVLSPNPAQNSIQIQSTDLLLDGNINVLNSLGQSISHHSISSTNQTTIAIDHLPKGIYFVQYIDKQKEKMAINKFVKQ